MARVRKAGVIARVVGWLFAAFIILLIIRFLLALGGVGDVIPIVGILYAIAGGLREVFHVIYYLFGIGDTPFLHGVWEWTTLVAILGYAVIGYLLWKLALRLGW